MPNAHYRLADFEYYMLADDRPDHPMTYFMRLHFSGRIVRSALDEALKTALARHPLLRSLVHELPCGRDYEWRATDALPYMNEDEAAAPLDFPRGETIDLQSEVGLRAWIRNETRSSQLWLQFHHGCCDGLGAFRFVEDLLACYALAVPRFNPQIRSQNPEALRPIDVSRLTTRGNFGQSWFGLIKRIPQELLGIAGAVKFFLRRPLTLLGTGGSVNDRPQPDGERVQPVGDRPQRVRRHEAYCTHQVSASVARQLRNVAHDQNATLNDLVLRDYFLAFDDWISTHQPAAHGNWVRIMLPMNLRTPADKVMPAANVVTMEFLDRNARDCGDANQLLAGIRDETRASKERKLGLRLIRVVGLVRALGLDMAPLLPERKCLATSVFSNLGDPLARTPLPRRNDRLLVGDLVLESIDVVPPLRPQTNVTLAAMIYGGELRFTLHYDTRTLSPREADDLMRAFAWRLEASAPNAMPKSEVPAVQFAPAGGQLQPMAS